MSRLVVVAPVMPPVPGGGGVYYALMRDELLAQSRVTDITIVTERLPSRYPLSAEGDDHLFRVLSPKHSQARLGPAWALAAAKQAWEFGRLRDLLMRLEPTHLLVHSSFHNRPTGISRLIRTAESLPRPPRLVCDVRDPLLPTSRFRGLDTYDVVIGCSQNVLSHLEGIPRPQRLVELPIPVAPDIPDRHRIEAALERHGLTERRYFFNASGLQRRKGLFRALDAIRRLWSGGTKLPLVVAGTQRVPDRAVREFIEAGILRYLGPIEPSSVVPLSVAAALDVNFSGVDSMPRHTLEALAAGARVTLPPGVPEFLPEAAAWVVPERIEEAADFLRGMLDDYRPPPYDVARHQPQAVFAAFADAIRL